MCLQIMLTVPQNAPVSIIADLMRILLVDMHCARAAVSRQPVLVLYAYDVTTGIVIDIGDRCNIVPIVDGYVVENAIVSLPYAGQQVCDTLRANMSEQKSALFAFSSPVERFILRYTMEQVLLYKLLSGV
jgi:actin-related protein